MPNIENTATFTGTQGIASNKCCKKCVNGKIQTYNFVARAACPGGYVNCRDADPVCEGGTCEQNCSSLTNAAEKLKCIAACKGTVVPPSTGCTTDADCPSGKCQGVQKDLAGRILKGSGKCGTTTPTCKEDCATKYPNAIDAPLKLKCLAACEGTIIPKTCEQKCQEKYPNEAQVALLELCYKDCKAEPPKIVCGKGAQGPVTTACPCGNGFLRTKEADACPAGYRAVGSGVDARCECDSYIPGETGAGQTFDFSTDVKSLLARLLQKANYFLDQPEETAAFSPETLSLKAGLAKRGEELLKTPTGMSEAVRNAIYNRSAESIKRQGATEKKSALDALARVGMLGSGLQVSEMGRVGRGVSENLAATSRDLAIKQEEDRIANLLSTTGMASSILGQQGTLDTTLEDMKTAVQNRLMGRTSMAQGILGTGMSADQLVESLNANRRGEGLESTNQLLQYLNMLLGNSSSYYAPYIQAILNQKYSTS